MNSTNLKIKQEFKEEVPTAPRISCDPCNIAFVAESDYFVHVKTTHMKLQVQQKENVPPHTLAAPGARPLLPPPLPTAPAFNQPFEFNQFNHLQMFQQPSAGQKTFNCDECPKSFQHEKNLKNHVKSKHKGLGKTFDCPECGKAYLQKHNLEEHIMVHHQNQRFNCTHCDQAYSSKKTLFVHIKAKHQGKTFNCDQCDAKYFYNHELMQHQRSKHQGVVYTCNQCNDSFVYKQSLKQHIRNVHEKIKDKKCEYCGLTFALHSGLYMHQKRKHEAEWLSKRAALAAAKAALREGLPPPDNPVPSVTQKSPAAALPPTSTMAPSTATMASVLPMAPVSSMASLTPLAPPQALKEQFRPTLTPMASVVPTAFTTPSFTPLTSTIMSSTLADLAPPAQFTQTTTFDPTYQLDSFH